MKHIKSAYEGTPSFVYLVPTANESFTIGEAVVLSSGKITKCGATATPSHIVAGAITDGVIACEPILKGDTYIAELAAAGTSLNVGDKVTLHTDGIKVTATTTNGVAEIVNFHGTASGDEVEIKF